MRFDSEKELEDYLRNLIATKICSNHSDLILFDNKKAVDILICRNGENPALFFLEVKYHKTKHGRLGFGSSSGDGFQPEIVSRAPMYFESNLRWLIAGEGHEGNGILFEPSSTIRKYLSGGVVGKKFNNIQKKVFREISGYQEDELVEKLREWLVNT